MSLHIMSVCINRRMYIHTNNVYMYTSLRYCVSVCVCTVSLEGEAYFLQCGRRLYIVFYG